MQQEKENADKEMHPASTASLRRGEAQYSFFVKPAWPRSLVEKKAKQRVVGGYSACSPSS